MAYLCAQALDLHADVVPVCNQLWGAHVGREAPRAHPRVLEHEPHELGEPSAHHPVTSLHKLPQVDRPVVAAAVTHLTRDVVVRLLYGRECVGLEVQHEGVAWFGDARVGRPRRSRCHGRGDLVVESLGHALQIGDDILNLHRPSGPPQCFVDLHSSLEKPMTCLTIGDLTDAVLDVGGQHDEMLVFRCLSAHVQLQLGPLQRGGKHGLNKLCLELRHPFGKCNLPSSRVLGELLQVLVLPCDGRVRRLADCASEGGDESVQSISRYRHLTHRVRPNVGPAVSRRDLDVIFGVNPEDTLSLGRVFFFQAFNVLFLLKKLRHIDRCLYRSHSHLVDVPPRHVGVGDLCLVLFPLIYTGICIFVSVMLILCFQPHVQ